MSGIDIRKKRPFGAVPDDILQDKRLSISARCVLAWMIGRPAGWIIRVEHMRHVLGLTDGVWRRIREELKACSYYVQERVRDSSGKFHWKIYITDTPGDLDSKPTPESPPPENTRMVKSTYGKTTNAHISDITKPNYQTKSMTTPSPPDGGSIFNIKGGVDPDLLVTATRDHLELQGKQLGPGLERMLRNRAREPNETDIAIIQAFVKANRRKAAEPTRARIRELESVLRAFPRHQTSLAELAELAPEHPFLRSDRRMVGADDDE